MCHKAVGTCPLVIHSILNRYETQKMCDKAFSEDSFMLEYCVDRYKTQKICDKPVQNFLSTLKLVLDCCLYKKNN